ESQNREPYMLTRLIWLDIEKQMHVSCKDLPSNLRRPLCNIILYYYGYKAEEWAAWIIMFSLLLFKG
ncbi:19586_t:CDS:1, partial [Cetraspora pellucida]